MKKIQIWAVEQDDRGEPLVNPVEEIESTETEAHLERYLVRSPELLARNLTLVGRQLPVEGGCLDLLGIDEDGRLVVFELKRGILTRDAVAQVVDYASDIARMEIGQVHRLIEKHSGQKEIARIEDFASWYSDNFPAQPNALWAKPRVVLVGLGVDRRALRMVDYLADSGVDIQLLTFHAFQKGGSLFLARQVEVTTTTVIPGVENGHSPITKEANREALRARAAKMNVEELLEEAAHFINVRLGAYQWPGRTRYSFSLTDRTEQGTSSARVYAALHLGQKSGALTVILAQRALDLAKPAVSNFQQQFQKVTEYNKRDRQLQIYVTRQTWPSVSTALEPVLEAVVAGWRAQEGQSPVLGSAEEPLAAGS